VLLVGVLKDFVADEVRTSALPGYGKVLFVMAATLGMLGGLYYFVEKLSQRGVETTHQAVRSLPLPFAFWMAHALLFLALFLLYAYSLEIRLI
jgi:hypothetical protein